MTAPATLDIKLLGRAYSVACPPEERAALLEAVALLDGQMAEVAKKTHSTGERVAVMVALNLAHELLTLKKAPPPAATPSDAATDGAAAEAFDSTDLRRRILAMEARLDEALAQQVDLF